MKVGDLVRRVEPIGPDGQPPAIGLVIDEDNRQTSPRYTIKWFTGTDPTGKFHVAETTGYGYNIEVLSESR